LLDKRRNLRYNGVTKFKDVININEELIVKPKLDVVFKKLFEENNDLLIDFLSYALHMQKEDIDDVIVTNPGFVPEDFGEKYVHLDLVLTQANGTKINIEIQNRDEGNYKERSVFNCSKIFAKDLKSGKDYITIPKTICINIVQFDLFEKAECVCTVFPTIQETGEIVTDKWEIIYFQTKKLPQNEKGGLWDWLKFFTISTKGELEIMENTATSGVSKAAVVIKQMNADDRMKEIARVREKAALTEGMIKYEAREEGIKLGASNRNLAIVQNMHSIGYPVEEISRAIGLSEKEVKSLINYSTVPPLQTDSAANARI
jgi:predicted transposase/invertase (TIGR01784 family)